VTIAAKAMVVSAMFFPRTRVMRGVAFIVSTLFEADLMELKLPAKWKKLASLARRDYPMPA
jgi:hypothetical protein